MAPLGTAARIGFAAAMMIFLIAPTFVVIPISFSSASFLSYPLPGLSLRWYAKVLQPDPWLNALWNSLFIGSMAAAVATVLGTLAALGLVRDNLPWRSALLGLIIAPTIVPVVITGVAIYFLFARVGLVGTYTGLILAHALLGAPFVIVTVTATLRNFDFTLIKAAFNLGASPLHAFRTVMLPLIAPGVLSGAIFAFVTSFDEVVVAIFISSPAQRTLPRQMFDGIRDNIEPTTIAVSSLLVAVSLVLMASAAWLSGRANRSAEPVR